ncbi:MAG: MFS transporter [Alphaproteobacteria bacterium]|nr:MFS transporter [Alphaproteobacteria bacterium]
MSATALQPAPLRLPALLARVYLPFAAAYFLSYLYRTVNAVVGPVIAAELNLSASDLGLLTSAYFIMFAGIQLPLGLALDRYGPRRVQATLLLFAAAGAAVFGLGTSLPELVAGRVLIGLGVAAGLMGALKVINLWFRAEHWPLMNGVLMAAGGLGSLVATAPAQAALGVMTWHTLFFWLSAATLAVSAFIFVVVPEREGTRAPGTLGEQMGAIGTILRSRAFWRLAPLASVQQASFIAIQTLWIGPWLRDVAGQDAATRSTSMLLAAVAMTVGFLSSGIVAGALSKRGISHFATSTGAIALFTVSLAALALFGAALPLGALVWWCAFAFLGTYVIVYYPVLTQAFPLELSGRVTTCLNFLMFSTVFLFQWGIGVILDLWPRTANGGYAPQGYAVAFGVCVAALAAGLAWMAVFRPKPD